MLLASTTVLGGQNLHRLVLTEETRIIACIDRLTLGSWIIKLRFHFSLQTDACELPGPCERRSLLAFEQIRYIERTVRFGQTFCPLDIRCLQQGPPLLQITTHYL